MLYYLFEILEKEYQLMGASLFQYISFRSAISFILSLLISTIFGKKIINFLRKKQIGDNTRELNLPGEKDKEGKLTKIFTYDETKKVPNEEEKESISKLILAIENYSESIKAED